MGSDAPGSADVRLHRSSLPIRLSNHHSYRAIRGPSTVPPPLISRSRSFPQPSKVSSLPAPVITDDPAPLTSTHRLGGDFSYGMIICPVRTDTTSISSAGTSHRSYEIWRRWSDCLLWQDTLEEEYTRMARSKKQRLVAGKGVKKNGVYIHDHASSFESLPPGPDPNSVHLNIHNHLTKLTKKNAVFRTSPSTAEQRTKELQAFIESLFSPDAPMLIVELREKRVVTDFFAYWRRDHDYAYKARREAEGKPRNSVSGSVFSLYFSSNLGEDVPASPPPTSPSLHSRSTKSRRPGTGSSTASSTTTASSTSFKEASPSPVPSEHCFRRPPRRRAPSSPSSSSSDGGSSRYSKGSDQLNQVTLDDSAIVLAYNPDQDEDGLAPPVPVKDSIVKIDPHEIPVPSLRRENRPTPINPNTGNRNGHVFMTTPILPGSPTESMSGRDEVSIFECQSISSIDHPMVLTGTFQPTTPTVLLGCRPQTTSNSSACLSAAPIRSIHSETA